MSTLLALHGEDYTRRIEEQKDQYQEIFEEVLPIFLDQGILPFDFLQQIVEASIGIQIKSPQKFSQKFDEFLSRHGVQGVQNVEYNTRIYWKGDNTGDTHKKKVRRINDQYTTFDYSLISTKAYKKNDKITKETLKLKDYSEVDDNKIIIPTEITQGENLLKLLGKLKDEH